MKSYDLNTIEGVDAIIADLDARIDAWRGDRAGDEFEGYLSARDHMVYSWRDHVAGDCDPEVCEFPNDLDPNGVVADLDAWVGRYFRPRTDAEWAAIWDAEAREGGGEMIPPRPPDRLWGLWTVTRAHPEGFWWSHIGGPARRRDVAPMTFVSRDDALETAEIERAENQALATDLHAAGIGDAPGPVPSITVALIGTAPPPWGDDTPV